MRNNIRKVSHPGKYVKEAIESLNMTQNEFAIRVGMTPKNINTLINEKSNITYEVAEKLSLFFDNSVDFWTNLQNKYESYLKLEQKEKEMAEEWQIVKLFDKDFLLDNCDIVVDNKRKQETIEQMRHCFEVTSLANLRNKDMFAFCRTSKQKKKDDKEIVLRNSWISLAIKKSNEMTCETFDTKKLDKEIPYIRSLTLLKPEEFTPKLIDVLKSVGIKYVELPYLKNSRISGVTKWVKNESAVVIAVNDYGKFADRIWFTIFHEIGHAIKNNKKHMTISYQDNNVIDEDEKFADEFAANSLIDKDDYDDFVYNRDFSLYSIKAFANKQGIHKDIVIGRLENDKYIRNGKFEKDKYYV